MFKKLGYEGLDVGGIIVYVKKETHSFEDDFVILKWEIDFIKKDKTICFYFYVDDQPRCEFETDTKVLQAIQKQIEELGW